MNDGISNEKSLWYMHIYIHFYTIHWANKMGTDTNITQYEIIHFKITNMFMLESKMFTKSWCL